MTPETSSEGLESCLRPPDPAFSPLTVNEAGPDVLIDRWVRACYEQDTFARCWLIWPNYAEKSLTLYDSHYLAPAGYVFDIQLWHLPVDGKDHAPWRFAIRWGEVRPNAQTLYRSSWTCLPHLGWRALRVKDCLNTAMLPACRIEIESRAESNRMALLWQFIVPRRYP